MVLISEEFSPHHINYQIEEYKREPTDEEKNNGTLSGKNNMNGHFSDRYNDTIDCLLSEVIYICNPLGIR